MSRRKTKDLAAELEGGIDSGEESPVKPSKGKRKGKHRAEAPIVTDPETVPKREEEDRHAEPEDEEEERGRPKQSNQHCFKCGKHGHTSKQCPIGRADRRTKMKCHICGKSGHIKS
eukprot:CAMPEP_0174366608 /NCGR_PEP_ID=MMETSP0811_2-20130205/81863_1 /TAXON_ID=73025 ORGANISM="Eutreptiella gymnastica-like, Strain CCMP1594" /NCGR_SAMPLE_ID=MMETSP0811_2 /ASSEMBLY_ACC=CAM_ASM_000667 /LENGTH=115 /DNA_ID=CAMNT_0015508337 /DNA_START=59 /DNA_END=402 /DNA_ORIENTATION=+